MSSVLLHDVGVAGVLEEHVLLLLGGLDEAPLALGHVLVDDLVVVQEERVEALVAVGDVPAQVAA